MKQMVAKPKHFEKIYKRFRASISERHDCGRYCAPLNGGQPVCCTVDHAIPSASPPEWKVMQKRTDMWRRYKPKDAESRKVVKEIEETCIACVCKGAAHCERENRLLGCRAFPFFPYLMRDGTLFGLAYYWTFEDRCWIISNLEVVEKQYVREFVEAYEMLIEADDGEFEAFHDQSSAMRRVFSRAGRDIPIIGREGGYYKVLAGTGGRIVPARLSEFEKHGPYESDEAYRQAVVEAAKTMDIKVKSLKLPETVMLRTGS